MFKLFRNGIIAGMIAAISLPVSAQEKYSKVRLPVTHEQIRQFAFSKLNADHFTMEGQQMLLVLNTSEMDALRQSGYPYELLIDDVVRHTTEFNSRIQPDEQRPAFQGNVCQKIGDLIQTPAAFGLGGSLRLGASAGNPGYLKYTEMHTHMQNMANAYPSLVSLFSIGNSAAGTPIYAVKISDQVGTDEAEPEVLYTGLQHAREAISGTSLIFFMEYLLENYASDSRIRELVDNREIFIIPCVNPDGYAYNYSGASASYPVTGGGLWRKNRRHTGGAASNIGVDLNRNYSVDWGNCSGASSSCGSSSQTSDTYFGPSAFSEPETQAVRAFVLSRKFVNAIDQHCHGSYYSLPYGRPSLHTPLSGADSCYFTRIPALMGLYNGHRAGNSPQTVNYEVAGGIKDWLLMGDIGSGTGPKAKVMGMTGEAGGGNFWAPVNQIIALCKENCFQNLQMAYAAGDYYELEDLNDMAITENDGKLVFRVRRIGLSGSPVTVTVIPLENMHTVGAAKTSTIASYYGTYTDSISYSLPAGFICGQTIRYVWKVEAGGISSFDTVTRIYNPITLLNDDMEGNFSDNWTASISPAGPTGWGFTSTQSYRGAKCMAESPTGNYTTSSTRIATYKNQIDLSDATAAYLSFWVRHKAENFRDRLQVQIATNGTNWTPVCGSHTIAENNTTNGGSLSGQPALTGIQDTWTRVTYDFKNFLGQGTVTLRLHFQSDADAGSFAFERDEGFHIDDLKLIKRSIVSVVPVKFGDIRGQLLTNNSIQIDWEAYTDSEHDYFEVERAGQASGPFESIERVKRLPPYRAIDEKPIAGMNYYRIRQVDINGTVTYSPVVKVYYATEGFSWMMYPNPVAEWITVRYSRISAAENIQCQVQDMSGRVMVRNSQRIQSGQGSVRLQVEHLPAQIYLLTVTGQDGRLIWRETFIKK